jgi:hypothetical protein
MNCNKCGVEPAHSYVDALGRTYTKEVCKKCREIQNQERILRNRLKPESKEYHRNYKLRTRFGLTSEQYDHMVRDQNNLCAICKCEAQFNSLHVDHCHKTNKVRGLLCFHCNTTLGHVKDDMAIVQNMIEYLRRYA